MNWTDQVSAISSLISAIASCVALFSVFLAIKAYRNDQKERQVREFKKTVVAVEEAALKIDQAVKRKIELEKSIPKPFDPFSYEHISKNHEVEAEVFSILNTYESLCYQTIQNLLVSEAWLEVRGDAFRNTIKQYTPYIDRYIEITQSPDAWKSCRTLYSNR